MLLEREGGELFLQQASQSEEGLVNRGQNQTWGRGGELFEEFLDAPPKQPEYLAAPLLQISRRPPNNRNTSPPPCWKFLAPSSQKKMRKTPVAYPWNPLVALGMGEAN